MMLTDLDLVTARDRLRTRDLTAADLTEAYLSAIAALNPRLNAYITVCADAARAQAAQADRALDAGQGGPLAGIPLGIKDLFCTAGVRTTAGSRILGPFIPPYESTVTAQLLRDGAVFLGKTNMDEFAMGSSNMTSAYGAVENPWQRAHDGPGGNAALVPGGSSGGSASAVAARLALGATATDTGGSIRQPASFCGLVGMKPTYGRCSRWGVVAFASSLDQAGTAGAHGHRLRGAVAVDGGVRCEGQHLGRRCAAGFRGRGGARRARVAHRRAARISRRGHAAGDRCVVAAGAGLVARRRRADRGRVVAAYQIRAGDVLHRGTGGGVVQSRAL